MEEVEEKKKRRYHRSVPTLKQIKALQYINQGMSKGAAMRKAGYAKGSAAHPTRVLMQKKGVKSILLSMAGELADAGLTTTFMVAKFEEWLEAKKIHSSPTEPDREVPDYKVQLEAYKEWKKVMDEQASGMAGANPGGIKRKLTIEEFITGGDSE